MPVPSVSVVSRIPGSWLRFACARAAVALASSCSPGRGRSRSRGPRSRSRSVCVTRSRPGTRTRTRARTRVLLVHAFKDTTPAGEPVHGARKRFSSREILSIDANRTR